MEVTAKSLHFNIIERELAVTKQKYQLTNSNHFRSMNNLDLEIQSPALKANKENVEKVNQGMRRSEPKLDLSNNKFEHPTSSQKVPPEKKSLENSSQGIKNHLKLDSSDKTQMRPPFNGYTSMARPAANGFASMTKPAQQGYTSLAKGRPNIGKRTFDKMLQSERPAVPLLNKGGAALKSKDIDKSFDGNDLTKKVKYDK